jgi:tRNA dimethylallyltransferase
VIKQQEQPPQKRLIPLLAIVGPTAVGKTKISIALAQKLNGEIISADSVQVYRYLNIGSAKPTMLERQGVPHHLIDIIDPDINFTVYDYQRRAKKAIQEIDHRSRLPILTGGTGLYIKAVLDDYHFSSGKTNVLIRKRLTEELALRGKEHFYQLLQQIDPPTAERVHPNDLRRIMRALEFFYLTGEPISRQRERTRKKKKNHYHLTLIGLTMKRNCLYEAINKRAEQMIQQGLLSEVRQLLARGYESSLKSLQSLGYYHLIRYLEGKWDWETAVSTFKRDTRRYAKRQLTWFRADERICWYTLGPQEDLNLILDHICSRIEGY